MLFMEEECLKCGRKYQPGRGNQGVCPECISAEFAAAPKLQQDEVEELRARNSAAARRQSVRMQRVQELYRNGAAFNMSGKILLCIGVFFVLFCHMLFLMDGLGHISWGGEDLDMESKKIVGLVFSSIAAGLLVMSTRRYKLLMFCMSLAVVLLGWMAPDLWKPSEQVTVAAEKNDKADATTADEETSAVSEEELAVFYTHCKKRPKATHYAVFMDNQDPSVRSIIRDVLTRLTEAEGTSAHTCRNGVLYVISSASGSRRNIAGLLTRFGHVVSSNVSTGVYLVKFDEEKTQLVSRFSSDVLSSPMHTSFVTANISELACIDAMRIRVAARSLKNADVQVLRTDVRNALVNVLQEPWGQDQDTYEALIDALVTYASKDDSEAVALCFRYLESRLKTHRQPLASVVTYLIKVQPEKMVEPVVSLWLSNPLMWESSLSEMSWRAQPRLIKILESGTAGIQEINSILRYMQNHGSKDAIPAVETLLEHPDSFIRYSAKGVLKTLESR